jgi:Fe(II)/alpha-ketoglutarate-dependent arginine beta-hydroxylase
VAEERGIVNHLAFTDSEQRECNELLDDIVSRYVSVEDPQFLKEAMVVAHEMPRRIRRFLNDFRFIEPAPGFAVISRCPINLETLPETPEHWKHKRGTKKILREEALLALLGSLLGDLIGWATQQDGYIVHDVLPIKDHEYEQLGTGSKELLWWHTEDAFHPFRCDYLGLFCLRNPGKVATMIASIDVTKLEESEIATLFEPHFIIRPDNSHQERHQSHERKNCGDDQLKSAYERIKSMNDRPEKLSVFFGHPRSPYLRIDPYFMEPADNEQARAAFEKLVRLIDASLIDCVLQPGDLIFIDNYRAVHGRVAFQARYDGQDRWLKRVNIAKDLRRSRTHRINCDSRVLY